MNLDSRLRKIVAQRLHGCTQAALAEELAVSQGTVSDIYLGRANHTSKATKLSIARQLGLEIYERKPRATIQVRPETRARLAAHKAGTETFDDTVNRLMDHYDKEANPMTLPDTLMVLDLPSWDAKATAIYNSLQDGETRDGWRREGEALIHITESEFDLCTCGHTREEHAPTGKCLTLLPPGPINTDPYCSCINFVLDEDML